MSGISSHLKLKLKFDRGMVVVLGLDTVLKLKESDLHIPHVEYDEKTNSLRALGIHYRSTVEYLHKQKISYRDGVLNLIQYPSSFSPSLQEELRDYQREALKSWWQRGKRGVVVLPTGSGKTIVALSAIAELNKNEKSRPCSTFIVVPTLDLVDQWKDLLSRFGSPVGEYTGRRKELGFMTVSTYDSSFIHAEHLGNKFKFIIFDEVHHLAAESYRQIAELFVSPYRLGLTATYEREDELHTLFPYLVGEKIYEEEVARLAGKHLAPYTLERIETELISEERELYGECMEKVKKFIALGGGGFDLERMVLRSGRSQEAWEALRSLGVARKIAYNSHNKMKVLRDILERHRGEKIILFTRYNDLVYRISKEFLIPSITYKTPKDERREILEGFKNDLYKAIVSSQVLDEGVDVPSANIGVIVSGTGSRREFIQRLGRILRPGKGKHAILYEIVSEKTSEVKTSYKRRRIAREKT